MNSIQEYRHDIQIEINISPFLFVSQVNNLSLKRLDMKSLSTRFHRPVRLDLL